MPALRIFQIAPVPVRRLRRHRQRQSVVYFDVYGVPGRWYAPQFISDHIASLGIY